MNDDRQAGSGKEVDHVKCGCDEYPECTHALYWYQGFKAGETWALAAAAPAPPAKVYALLDYEADGDALISVHATEESANKAKELVAPIRCWIQECDVVAPPPQDGQGAEPAKGDWPGGNERFPNAAESDFLAQISHPPSGGQLSHLAATDSLIRAVDDDTECPACDGKYQCTLDRNHAGPHKAHGFDRVLHEWTQFVPITDAERKAYEKETAALGPPRGGSSSDLAEPSNPGAVKADEILMRIAQRYENCKVNIYPDMPYLTPVEAVLRCAQEEGFRLTSIVPEAVAGNASAPVGEPSATVVSANESAVIPLDKLSEEWDRLDRYYSQLADVAAGAGYDKGSFIGKSIGFSVCAAQLRAALPASSGMGSGQPSGVGEPPIKKFQVLMDRMVGVYRVAVEPVPSPLQPLQAIAQEQANQAWFIEQAISEKLEREK